MFRESNLSALSWQHLADAFQRVYQGYTVTLASDAEWAENHVTRNDIQLEHSPLWFDQNDHIAALAALGVRERRGWIGAFGIAPDQRGQGYAAPLLDAVITQAEEIGLETVQLEVLHTNTPALRCYQTFGFEITRKLVTLTCPLDFPSGPWETCEEYHWKRFPKPDLSMAWQRQIPGAARNGGRLLLADDAWIGFRLQKNSLQIIDGYGSPQELEDMFADLRDRYPRLPLICTNEPVGTAWYSALTALNWTESLSQWEMCYRIENLDP